jgi:hypothetical protein
MENKWKEKYGDAWKMKRMQLQVARMAQLPRKRKHEKNG